MRSTPNTVYDKLRAEVKEGKTCQDQLLRAIEHERNENAKLRARILALERELCGDIDPESVGWDGSG